MLEVLNTNFKNDKKRWCCSSRTQRMEMVKKTKNRSFKNRTTETTYTYGYDWRPCDAPNRSSNPTCLATLTCSLLVVESAYQTLQPLCVNFTYTSWRDQWLSLQNCYPTLALPKKSDFINRLVSKKHSTKLPCGCNGFINFSQTTGGKGNHSKDTFLTNRVMLLRLQLRHPAQRTSVLFTVLNWVKFMPAYSIP